MYHRPLPGAAALAACLMALPSPSAADPTTNTGAARTLVENVQLEGFDEPVSILCSDGRIEAVLAAGADAPLGVRRIDGQGYLAVPGFLDASARKGFDAPEARIDQDRPTDTGRDVRIDMRRANRKGIRPAFRAAEALSIGADEAKSWQEAGFGTLVASPGGELLAGRSALVAIRDAAARDLVIDGEGWAQAGFRASGEGYPSTLMGYFAQLRQFFLDVQYKEILEERGSARRPGPRPVFDAELDAGRAMLASERPVFCSAGSHRDGERWLSLGSELGFQQIALVGGRDLWRLAERLADSGVPVVLTLDWGDEVDVPKEDEEQDEQADEGESAEEESPELEGDAEQVDSVEAEEPESGEPESESDESDESEDEAADWTYELPLRVRREERRLWEEKRDGAAVLHDAGVEVVFGTGNRKPTELLKNLRQAVEAGLDRETAVHALTTGAAALFGVEQRLGRIEPGYDATFALWTADPMDEDAQVAWMFVDGYGSEFEIKDKSGDGEPPAEGVDATGTWELVDPDESDEEPSTLTIEMDEDGDVSGKLVARSPRGESETSVSGHVSGTTLTLEGTLSIGDRFTIDISIEGELDGDSLTGERTMKGESFERTKKLRGTRTPEEVR